LKRRGGVEEGVVKTRARAQVVASSVPESGESRQRDESSEYAGGVGGGSHIVAGGGGYRAGAAVFCPALLLKMFFTGRFKNLCRLRLLLVFLRLGFCSPRSRPNHLRSIGVWSRRGESHPFLHGMLESRHGTLHTRPQPHPHPSAESARHSAPHRHDVAFQEAVPLPAVP